MRRSAFLTSTLLLIVAVAPPAWPQSIQTDGNIETDAQVVSNVATGTAPLTVASTTRVPNLNADRVDGMEAAAFAQEADLQNVETLLTALQEQVDGLALSSLPRTGQATCFDAAGAVATCGTGIGLGQDGDFQMGVMWPNPRFADNGNGTVTDSLTALVWLEEANCFGTQTWANALAKASVLFDGCPDCGGTANDCGLSDGSLAGAWRLPNVRELQSLIHYGVFTPAVPNAAGTGQWSEGDPFSGVQSDFYWSSTTLASGNANAWGVDLDGGGVGNIGNKAVSNRVWLVRGGQ